MLSIRPQLACTSHLCSWIALPCYWIELTSVSPSPCSYLEFECEGHRRVWLSRCPPLGRQGPAQHFSFDGVNLLNAETMRRRKHQRFSVRAVMPRNCAPEPGIVTLMGLLRFESHLVGYIATRKMEQEKAASSDRSRAEKITRLEKQRFSQGRPRRNVLLRSYGITSSAY